MSNIRCGGLPVLIFFLFFGNQVIAQNKERNNWQDTLNKYLRTAPNVSVIGLNKALSSGNLKSELIKLDMMIALVNDYGQLRKTDSAMYFAQESNRLSILLKDTLRISRSYLTLAWTSRDVGKVNDVLNYTLKAEELAEKIGDKMLLSMAANTLASVYYDLKNDSLQKHYLEKSYQIEKEANGGKGAYTTMTNLGYIYFKEGANKKALEMFEKAVLYAKQDKRIYADLTMLYNHLIDVYEAEKQYGKCVQSIDSLERVLNTLQDEHSLIHLRAKKAFYLSLSGKQQTPIRLLKAFNKLDISSQPVDAIKSMLFDKYRINAHFKHFEKALFYLEEYRILNDSLAGEDLREQVAFYKEQFDAEKREGQIEKLKSEKKVIALEAEKQKSQIVFLIIGLIVMIGFSSLFYFLYSKLKRVTSELEELNGVKDRFFAIISHDLRSSVTAFQGVGEIIDAYVKKEKWERLIALGQKVDAEANKLSVFLNNLLNWSMTQIDRVPYNPENIPIKEKIDEVLSLMEAQIQSKKISIAVEVEEGHTVFADSDALSLVVRNLFSNAVKYSHPESRISVYSTVEKHAVSVFVKDEGQGMDKRKLNSLFSPASKTSEKGTQGEEGSGLGLVLVKEFLKINKGKIAVESQLGKGTTFSFQLPLSQA